MRRARLYHLYHHPHQPPPPAEERLRVRVLRALGQAERDLAAAGGRGPGRERGAPASRGRAKARQHPHKTARARQAAGADSSRYGGAAQPHDIHAAAAPRAWMLPLKRSVSNSADPSPPCVGTTWGACARPTWRSVVGGASAGALTSSVQPGAKAEGSGGS